MRYQRGGATNYIGILMNKLMEILHFFHGIRPIFKEEILLKQKFTKKFIENLIFALSTQKFCI